jgi:hypothetical protein
LQSLDAVGFAIFTGYDNDLGVWMLTPHAGDCGKIKGFNKVDDHDIKRFPTGFQLHRNGRYRGHITGRREGSPHKAAELALVRQNQDACAPY